MYWISPGSCGITFRKMFIRALALIFRRRLTGAALLIGLSMAHGVSAQEPAPAGAMAHLTIALYMLRRRILD